MTQGRVGAIKEQRQYFLKVDYWGARCSGYSTVIRGCNNNNNDVVVLTDFVRLHCGRDRGEILILTELVVGYNMYLST